MKRRKGYRKLVESELETLPLMGLFVVLIPMLLLSAVFLEISVIDLNLPDDEQSQESTPNFTLSVRILDDRYTIEAKGTPVKVIKPKDLNALETLTKELASIRTRRPDHESLTIISESSTRYEDIIAVMDVSRDAGLPEISLAGEGS